MRMAAEAKMGYYPVQHETIDALLQHIECADPANTSILDPCCGTGMALDYWGRMLGTTQLYGVELDHGRFTIAQSTYKINVVNASFFGMRIVPICSFSLAWVNPPYDNELKQAEKEYTRSLEDAFLEECCRCTIAGGMVILHCPDKRIDSTIISTMNQYCDNVRRVTLPANLRPFGEGLLVGRRRERKERGYNPSVVKCELHQLPQYKLPAGDTIRHFNKVEPMETEILAALDQASFWKVMDEPPVRNKLEPLLPLGPGHLGLTLASGYLDGYFAPEGFEPHVVRGIAYKEEKMAKQETTEDDEGKQTTTTVMRENIKLKIRTINRDGVIHEIK